MARRAWGSAMVAAALLAGCDPSAAPPAGAEAAGLRLSFETVLAPEVYRREGRADIEPPDEAPGLWAVAPGLPRPERGLVENLATGARVDVALFAGPSGGAIRLSGAAAQAIGARGAGTRVRVTALRREPRIAAP